MDNNKETLSKILIEKHKDIYKKIADEQIRLNNRELFEPQSKEENIEYQNFIIESLNSYKDFINRCEESFKQIGEYKQDKRKFKSLKESKELWNKWIKEELDND